MEEAADVPPMTVTSATLRPHIEDCGYLGDRIEENYSFGAGSIALAGFIGKPWDARSACLAVVDATTDSRLAAHNCIQFGAPTALVCRGDSFDWWQLSFNGPREPQTIRANEIDGFFRRHSAQFKPENIYAAKLHREVQSGVQMSFVDVGLMPALERQTGEALNRLVSQAIRSLLDDLASKVRSSSAERGVYKTVFWMLAAKLLKEKKVQGFKSLNLEDVQQVFKVVGQHYKDAQDYPPGDKTWRPAIARVAESIAGWGALGNISAESLAYLYERSLIDGPKNQRKKGSGKSQPDVRKTLGIHSTPSILVDHMLAQIWPLVDSNILQDQRVFEPACGHGAFLTAAMRDIRNWSGMEDSAARHRYLRERVRGIELDPFAAEIAKLSLTLADVPHGNTWQIEAGDMFKPGVLRKASEWATIVLSNPPYETFKKTNANRYLRSDEPVSAQTKAVEMLKRVVPNLAPGAVFGFVLPQGTLYDREAKQFRNDLLESCEVAEISLFEDGLFTIADQETCILIGRRKSGKSRVSHVVYRRVRNRDMHHFKSALHFSQEDVILPSRLGRGEGNILYEPDLRTVWQFLESVPLLSNSFDVQKGFEFKSSRQLGERSVVSATPKNKYSIGILNANEDYSVWALPAPVWVDLRPQSVRRLGSAASIGVPQIVINYSGPRESWRFRPVIDNEGIAVSSRFLSIRPRLNAMHSLITLWATMLSPIANAYAYSWSGKRQTLVKEWEAMPLPAPTAAQKMEIEAAAAEYIELVVPTQEFTLTPPDEPAIRRALLELDAAVLRLYDLSDELERRLLAIFDDVERPGVGCTFRGYPPGWSSRLASPSFKMPSDDRPVWERIAELSRSLPDEVVAALPRDGASQLDHYLYGAPKKKR